MDDDDGTESMVDVQASVNDDSGCSVVVAVVMVVVVVFVVAFSSGFGFGLLHIVRILGFSSKPDIGFTFSFSSINFFSSSDFLMVISGCRCLICR